MASTLMVVDALNLFVGDDDATGGQYLTIKNVKIPALSEKTKEHSPGGGVMSVNLGMKLIEPLEFTFKLEGMNPEVMGRFMPGAGRINYTARGNIRDVQAGTDIALVAVINGRMTKAEPGEFGRDNGIENDYTISEIMRYQLMIGGQEKYYADFFAGLTGFRVDGQIMFRAAARNLGLI